MNKSPKNSDSAQAAAQADQRKEAARAPKTPHQERSAKEKPPETGKPLFDKPHSS